MLLETLQNKGFNENLLNNNLNDCCIENIKLRIKKTKNVVLNPFFSLKMYFLR